MACNLPKTCVAILLLLDSRKPELWARETRDLCDRTLEGFWARFCAVGFWDNVTIRRKQSCGVEV
jgi:hypothetical protein